MRVHKKFLARVNAVNHLVQATLFSIIFTFTSNIRGIRAIFERGLDGILFPLAIIPDAIASFLTIVNFVRTKNRNLGKTFDLIFIPARATLVFTAVFAGLSLVFVHSLFLAAVSSGLVYHGVLSLYNAYHYWKTPANSPSHLKLKNLHKQNAINHGVFSLMGAIILMGIITTLVFASTLPPAILTAVGISTAIMLMATAVYSHMYSFKINKPEIFSNIHEAEATEANPSSTKSYYYRKFRSEKLNSTDLVQNKIYLTKEIVDKKNQLDRQIEGCARVCEFFFRENSKRQAKKDFLDKIITQLHKFNPELDGVSHRSEAIHELKKILSSAQKKVFQSFFRAKSDTADIANAIKELVDGNDEKRFIIASERTSETELSSVPNTEFKTMNPSCLRS